MSEPLKVGDQVMLVNDPRYHLGNKLPLVGKCGVINIEARHTCSPGMYSIEKSYGVDLGDYGCHNFVGPLLRKIPPAQDWQKLCQLDKIPAKAMRHLLTEALAETVDDIAIPLR